MDVRERLVKAVALDESSLELHALLDQLVEDEAWDDLVQVADLARADREFWFAGHIVQGRLVLGPPEVAALALHRPFPGDEPSTDVFEMAANAHSWAELSPHLDDSALRLRFAYERVLWGEALDDVADLDAGVFGVPFHLEPWEGRYLFTNRRGFPPVSVKSPPGPPGAAEIAPLPPPGTLLRDDPVRRALVDLPIRWETESHGEVRAVRVKGDMRAAFSALGHARGGLQPDTPRHALTGLAHASATGGGHGGRDGSVAARVKCWRLLAALAGYDGPLPYPAEDLGAAGERARWFKFTPAWEQYDRWIWEFHLGIERPESGESWALSAGDTD
jgi:hypothetical protein